MEKTKKQKEQILKRIRELELEREWCLDESLMNHAEYVRRLPELEAELASCQTALESFVKSIVE